MMPPEPPDPPVPLAPPIPPDPPLPAGPPLPPVLDASATTSSTDSIPRTALQPDADTAKPTAATQTDRTVDGLITTLLG
jgi:hypothetical protein